MSSSEGEYNYQNYHISWYQAGVGPPLIKKRSRVIAAVAQNHVDLLSELFDSPRWYNVKDKMGLNLLQIAFRKRNKEVFDYMLSIPDFPIDRRNKYNRTALSLALDDGWWNERSSDIEYFPHELVKRGASIDFLCNRDNPPLLRALHQSFNNVAIELIKRGADVNAHDELGCTPIYCALLMKVSATEITEVVMTLLQEGAAPSNEEFECSVIKDSPFFIQEMLFLHSIDQYSELDFRVLVKLARNKSPLFHEIVKCSSKVKCREDCWYDSFIDLCMMEADYLEIIIQKFGTCLAEFGHHTLLYRLRYAEEKLNIKNLDILLKNEFKFDVIYPACSSGHLFNRLPNLPYDNESYVSEVYLYLLSYGLVLREEDLQFVYSKFGYCELFRLLLHMDFEQRHETGRKKHIIPVFIYDLKMDVQKFFRYSDNFRSDASAHLRGYFFHPRLSDKGSIPKNETPRLLELARNSFRNYFINRYNIKTARNFYTLLKHLPISIVFKKIISYETKLY